MSVYMIRDGQGRIKIGCSTNPEARQRSLQSASADRLTLIRVIEGRGPATEKWLHKKFNHLHLTGEWFQYSREMLHVAPPDEPCIFIAVSTSITGILWGAKAIGAAINKNAHHTSYLLRTGAIECAVKKGALWCADAEALRKEFKCEAPDAR
jgi:hypothetical protein